MTPEPPKIARKLLYSFLRDDLAEEVSGDLEERFRLALKKRPLWLEGFAYRVDVTWWTFALAGLLAFVIANVSIGYQSVKAAAMDPVDSLRGE